MSLRILWASAKKLSIYILEAVYPQMALAAKRYKIRHLHSQVRMFCKGLDVMGYARAHAPASRCIALAALTGEIISSIHRPQQYFPLISFVQALTLWRRAALPRRITRTRLHTSVRLSSITALDTKSLHELDDYRGVDTALARYIRRAAPFRYILLDQPISRLVRRIATVVASSVFSPLILATCPICRRAATASTQRRIAKLLEMLDWPASLTVGVGLSSATKGNTGTLQGVDDGVSVNTKVGGNGSAAIPRTIWQACCVTPNYLETISIGQSAVVIPTRHIALPNAKRERMYYSTLMHYGQRL